MAGVAKTCRILLMSACTHEFLTGGEIRPNARWHMPWHSHGVHELIIVLGGKMLLETADRTVHAEAGDLLFYRAGCAHRETSDRKEPVNTLFLSFKADEARTKALDLRIHDADGRVRQMAGWLVRDHEAGCAAEQLAPLLDAVLIEVKRLCSSPPDPWLAEIRRHMQRYHALPLYLDDLARRMGMSKFAFVRKFKRLNGRTPMQELQSIRLNQARAMMLVSNQPVKAIAAAVGLNDEYQLSKLFRRHFHFSPRELRTRLARCPAG